MKQTNPLPNLPIAPQTLTNPAVNTSSSKRPILIVLLILLLVVLSILISINSEIIYADMGTPPTYSQGGSIQSSTASTNVSMDYERVILTYGNPQRKYSDGREYGTTMPAHVSAVFKMKNNSSQAESMNVFFPSNDELHMGGIHDDITNFKVNGKLLSKENQTQMPIVINGYEGKILAYQWNEVFGPQQITEVTVEYDTKSEKEVEAYRLTYVLGTGRGWQGNIRQGEISFVLPENLTSYSVSNWSNGKANKLSITVLGNTITVKFSEYEPNSDDVIILGVYEFNIVSQIEQLKREPESFTTTLKIAELFRELSVGGHCIFCVGVAADNAEKYYNLALNKAVSKDELNSVLKSFAYGDDDRVNVNDLLKMISLTQCEVDNNDCKASIYADRDKLGGTPFTLADSKVRNSAFLVNYANKIQSYDPTITTSVNKFISGAKAVSDYLKQKYLQTQTTIQPTQPQSVNPSGQLTQVTANSKIQPESKEKKTLPILGITVASLMVFSLAAIVFIKKLKPNLFPKINTKQIKDIEVEKDDNNLPIQIL